ncbi:MAG: site-specific DNA-methyltransferase [Verrucomicrobia bacterium]|nr:site-specific DNA-methyltransferase [Verrucomicrobiota bacterium]
MPTLNWIGKEAVVNHHHKVPFHLLKDVPDLSVGDPGSGNLIVQGDNLVALKALLPYYAGQVKCVCVDPPYNTGEQKWTYSDQVNSPLISAWLGKTVGDEATDLSRHDKWLCMMYPRVKLLLEFLRDDGFLMVALNDEGEVARFRVMMDEMLAKERYVCSLVWKSRRNLDNRSLHNVSVDHEYIVVYSGPEAAFRGLATDKDRYTNPDNDPRGPWTSDNLVGLATKDRRPNLHYELVNPKTGIAYPCPRMGWRYSKETMAQMISEGRILWPKSSTGRPRNKKFLADLQKHFTGFSSLVDCGNTNEGTLEVRQILGDEVFMFPKPRSLVQQLVQQSTDSDSLVLDSFGGSGTTAHAVLAQNKEDGGNRRFILVEMESSICRDITAERVRRVINGYGDTPGLGGGFRYCELGEPLFDERGQIKPSVRFADLARHVYFTETGEPLPRERVPNTPRLGVCRGVGVYLLFNGILADKSVNGGNVLTRAVLEKLPKHDGPKVVYAAGCRLGKETLRAEQITFRQTPYEIKVS